MPRWLATSIVVAALGGAVALAAARVNVAWNWSGVWEYREKLLHGWLMTVALSLAALVVSTLVGGLAAALLRSRHQLPAAAARVYVELIRTDQIMLVLWAFP